MDVSRQDKGLDRSPLQEAETPIGALDHYTILSNFEVAGEMKCDKWLEKLLQSILTARQKDEETQAENQDGRTDHKNGSHNKITDAGQMQLFMQLLPLRRQHMTASLLMRSITERCVNLHSISWW